MRVSNRIKLSFSLLALVILTATSAPCAENNLTSGEVLFLSTYTCDMLPSFTGNGVDAFVAHSKQQKQRVTYQRYIQASFNQDKCRIEVNVDADGVFFNSPISNVSIWNGSTLALLDNVKGTFRTRKNAKPYLQSTDGLNHLHPSFAGYAYKTILDQVYKVKNKEGALPGIIIKENSNTTTIVGDYVESGIKANLAKFEWMDSNKEIYKKALFYVSDSKSAVELTLSKFTEFNGTVFPQSIIVRQRFAPSLDEFESGLFISDQEITVLNANFNQTLNSSKFSIVPPEGFTVLAQVR